LWVFDFQKTKYLSWKDICFNFHKQITWSYFVNRNTIFLSTKTMGFFILCKPTVLFLITNNYFFKFYQNFTILSASNSNLPDVNLTCNTFSLPFMDLLLIFFLILPQIIIEHHHRIFSSSNWSKFDTKNVIVLQLHNHD